MKVALIVANAPHLKTEQVTLGLLSRNIKDIMIVTVPFVPRRARNPVFNHRPDQSQSIDLDTLATMYGLSCFHTKKIDEFDTKDVDICIMTGGVLLPASFLEKGCPRVLNCHPGLIPECRGLDAFKWAILEGHQVGNTLHFIDNRVDLGHILHRKPTPVFIADSLESFATRHYANELDILSNFQKYLENRPVDAATLEPIGPRRMRMTAETEVGLEAAFNTYKARYANYGSK